MLLHLFPLTFFSSPILDSEFENVLHCIGFTGVSSFLVILFRHFIDSGILIRPIFLYSTTFFFTISIGALSEFVQIFFNRDATFSDLLRDASGALIGLLLVASCKRSRSVFEKPLSLSLKIAALGIFTFTMLPFITICLALLLRNCSFPQLYTFEKWWENKFISLNEIDLEIEKPPKNWQNNLTKTAGKITFAKGRYPGIAFKQF